MPRISVSGGTPAGVFGHTPSQSSGDPDVVPGVPIIKLDPIQVVGFVPLTTCDAVECRQFCECPYILKVFGELVGRGFQLNQTYENDWSSFLIDISSFNANPNTVTATFELEKLVNGIWKPFPDGILLNAGNYGQLFSLGNIPGHPTYAGYNLNWGSILYYSGAGCYRFKARTSFVTTIITTVSGGTQATWTFNLMSDNCMVGAINGILQTLTGTPAAYYSFNQTNTSFTQAQNVQFIVNYINAQSLPYTAVYNGGNSFTITGQNFAYNNGVNFQLTTWKGAPGGGTTCTRQQTANITIGVNPVSTSSTTIYRGCLESPLFELKEFDCLLAHTTTKFESTLTGKIGSITVDGIVYDLCGMNWYDSIRLKGMFGFEGTEYDEVLLEHQNGLIDRVRDEALQKFQWKSSVRGIPKVFFDRLKVYGLMADKLLVSDYNRNNSDWEIKRKLVVKAGGFKPEYRINSRLSKVTVDFAEGIQSVIKSICCDPKGT